MGKILESMEGTLVPLKVKSKLNNYSITFYEDINGLFNALDKDCWYVIDKNLQQLYNFNFLPKKIYYECNEITKSFEHIEILLNEFVKNKFKYNTQVIVIGGGTL